MTVNQTAWLQYSCPLEIKNPSRRRGTDVKINSTDYGTIGVLFIAEVPEGCVLRALEGAGAFSVGMPYLLSKSRTM